MSEQDRKRLKEIQTFPALVKYLREDLRWPVEQDNFDDIDDLTFDWDAEELGIDPKHAAKIEYVKQLRPLENGQPQGVFFVKFDTRRLPVVVMRKLLQTLVVKKRASARGADRPLWEMRNLVFISSYGESTERQLSFAYFQEPASKDERPALKVLGWDDTDTPLHLDKVHDLLQSHLTWPKTSKELPAWRARWSAAFQVGHGETVRTAKELAEELAALARRIREQAKQLLKIETEQGPLRALMAAFKKALIHDLTDEQFADMYAQTIAYGLLSARITHPDPVKAETLPDLIPVTNPFLKELMETFVLAGGKHRGTRKAHQIDFDELGINDVVELLRRANMDAVLRDFGAEDRKEDPVLYFYEGFAKAYDPIERMRRGEFYTPRPVVSYIVRSVQELLQTQFGIEDGLAATVTWGEMAARQKKLLIPQDVPADSPFVRVLDPATGTGTFLIEVIEVVLATLTARWRKEGLSAAEQTEAWNAYVPKHLLPRLYGFELKMAPYAIAHLKIGLKLFETGYRFASNERARVYLTNTLEPPSDGVYSQIDALSEALAHEAQAVNAVKRTQLFTVVVGNPPYSSMSSNLAPEHRRIIDAYRSVDGIRIKERGALQLEKNLQDDYVKFIRMAQVACDRSPMSVMGFISNHAYIDNPTLRGLRRSLLGTFGNIYVLDLHGNSKRKENCPLPEADENVFDIQQGVCILVAAKSLEETASQVSWGELWGSRSRKYEALGSKTVTALSTRHISATGPSYLFVDQDDALFAEFGAWTPIDQIFALYSTGVATARDGLTVHFTVAELRTTAEEFCELPVERARARFKLGPDTNAWKVQLAQKDLRRIALGSKWQRAYQYRPFDRRQTFYTGQPSGFHCNPRWPVMRNLIAGPNLALCCAKTVETGHEYAHVFVTNAIADHHSVSLKEVNYVFPSLTYPSGSEGDSDSQRGLFKQENTGPESNLSLTFRTHIKRTLGVTISESVPAFGSANVMAYIYAVLNSPKYRARYSNFLRKGFASVPLGANVALFEELARIGRELVALHLMDSPKLDDFITTYTGPKSPEVGRVDWLDNTIWLDAGAEKKGHPATLGSAGFTGVSGAVWKFHVGSYQVCQKWLKDRKGRKLSKDDIEHYQKIVVAISETIRIMRQIDEVIDRHGGWPGAFQAPLQAN